MSDYETEQAGNDQAGETRTANATGSGDAETTDQRGGGQPTPTRSPTTEADINRTPEAAGDMARDVTPNPSERVMGLPDSPTAAETNTGR